jgi:hypothetical protein
MGQDVERVAGNVGLLDETRGHALRGHRRQHEVAAELREDPSRRRFAHLVPGPADALETARHRRRRLDLHHQVDGAHVDAELER